ncbi:hypothetical protein LSH36_414g02014 [Paralvinella palmiformis]|uniref:Uncharacterized protein n=1 Tax=Paralvinella palmiformis TaxID=53620 RepID=A0AAD9JBZ6_9ANNE|nr:hypothetical protein LSH36_414g02014 [Paralvinella palmiformis]
MTPFDDTGHLTSSLSIIADWDDIPRQFISGTAEWVDEPEVVSYVKCHQPCPTDVRSTNTTNICISQMEKTVGVSVDVEVEPGVPTPRHATVLPPADEHVNRTEDATSARSGSGTSALPTFWISYLLAGFTLFSGCPDVAHVTLLVSYHRVIGLT